MIGVVELKQLAKKKRDIERHLSPISRNIIQIPVRQRKSSTLRWTEKEKHGTSICDKTQSYTEFIFPRLHAQIRKKQESSASLQLIVSELVSVHSTN